MDHPIFSKVKANDADIHIVNIGDRFTFLGVRGGLSLGSQGPRTDRPLLVDLSRKPKVTSFDAHRGTSDFVHGRSIIRQVAPIASEFPNDFARYYTAKLLVDELA